MIVHSLFLNRLAICILAYVGISAILECIIILYGKRADVTPFDIENLKSKIGKASWFIYIICFLLIIITTPRSPLP